MYDNVLYKSTIFQNRLTYYYIEKYEAVNFALRDKGPNLYRIDVNSIKTY